MAFHKQVGKDQGSETEKIPWLLGTNYDATYSQHQKNQGHHKVQKGLEQAEPQNQWKAVKNVNCYLYSLVSDVTSKKSKTEKIQFEFYKICLY